MIKTLAYHIWVDQYKPILDPDDNYTSPLDCDPRLSDNNITQAQFTTAVNESRVWTLVDGDGEEDYNKHGESINHTMLIAGYHYVNRLEHYITEIPWTNKNLKITT